MGIRFEAPIWLLLLASFVAGHELMNRWWCIDKGLRIRSNRARCMAAPAIHLHEMVRAPTAGP